MCGLLIRFWITAIIIALVHSDAFKTNAENASPSTEPDTTTPVQTTVTDPDNEHSVTYLTLTTSTEANKTSSVATTSGVITTYLPTDSTPTECKLPCVTSGYFTGDNNTVGSTIAITCDPVCDFPDIPNGTYTVGNNTVNSTIEVHCNDGFKLASNQTFTCHADGAWSGTPKCDPIICDFPDIPNGNYTVGNNTVNSTIEVNCNDGFKLASNQTFTCHADGAWSGTPKCDPIICDFPDIPNGNYTVGNNTVNSTIEVHCNDGFKLASNQTFTCHADGAWSGTPKCDPIICDFPDIPNGNYTVGNNTVNSTIEVHCNDGFKLASNQTFTCHADGAWSGTPKCDPINATYGSECVVDVQCLTLNASCIDNTCRCLNNSHYIDLLDTCATKLAFGKKFTMKVMPENETSVQVQCTMTSPDNSYIDAVYVELTNKDMTTGRTGYFNITKDNETIIEFTVLKPGTRYTMQVWLSQGGFPSDESQTIDIVTLPMCTYYWRKDNVSKDSVTFINDLPNDISFEYYDVKQDSIGRLVIPNITCYCNISECVFDKHSTRFTISGLHPGSPYHVFFQTSIGKENCIFASSNTICQNISGHTVPDLPEIRILEGTITDHSFKVELVENEILQFETWMIEVYNETDRVANLTQSRNNKSMILSNGIMSATKYAVCLTVFIGEESSESHNQTVSTRPQDSSPAYVSNIMTTTITLSFMYEPTVPNFTHFVVVVHALSTVQFNITCENISNECTFERLNAITIYNLTSGTQCNITVYTAFQGMKNAVPQNISIYTVPSTPTNLEIPAELVFENNFTVNFIMPDDRYDFVEFNTCEVDNGTCVESKIDNNLNQSGVVTNLKGGKMYSITATAVLFDNIESAVSRAEESVTAPLPPDVKYAGSEINSIKMNISHKEGGDFDSYFIQYNQIEPSISAPYSWKSEFNMTVSNESNTALMQNLEKGSKYIIRVFTVLRLIRSERYYSFSAFTRPVSISNSSVTISERTNSTLKVTWNPVSIGHVDGYNVVFVCLSPNDDKSMSVKTSYSTTTADITGLDPGTLCNISIETFIENGIYGNLTGEIVSEQLSQSTKEEAPAVVSTVNVTKISSKSAVVKWSQPYIRNGIIRQYIIRIQLEERCISGTLLNCTDCRGSDNGLFDSALCPFNTTISYLKNETAFSLDFMDLHPYRNYTYIISAFTEAQGPEVINGFQTLEDIPGMPVDVKHSHSSHSEIAITWKPPIERNGEVLNYNIKYEFERRMCRGRGDSREIVRNETNSFVNLTEDIYPYWNYSIWVSATNKIGTGHYSGLLSVTTKDTYPSSDINTASSIWLTSNEANITWLDPCFSNGHLSKFYLELKNISRENHIVDEWWANPTEHHFVFDNLLPFRNYSVRVKAANEAGNGSYGPGYAFQTSIAAPDVPLDVLKGNSTSASIEVQWNRAIQFTGPTQYTVVLTDTRNDTLVYNTTTHTGWWIDELANTSVVLDLDAFWNYSVQVIAETAYRDLSYRKLSTPVILTTAEDLPGKVQKLSVNPETDLTKPRQMNVTWDTPAERDLNGIIVRYEIYCTNRNKTNYTSPFERSIVIPLAIDNEVDVMVKVRASTNVGWGEWEQSTVTVKPGAPESPVEQPNNPATKKADISVADDKKMIAVLLPKHFLCNHKNGEPLDWGVIVAQDSMANGPSFIGSDSEYESHKANHYKKWSDVKIEDNIRAYIATNDAWTPTCGTNEIRRRRRDVSDQGHLPFIVGSEDCSNNNGFCNGPLQPGRSYRVKSYACTKTGCTETLYSLPIKTAPNLIPAIAGGLAAAAVVIVIVAVIVYTKRTNKLCFFGNSKAVKSAHIEKTIEITEVASEYIFKSGSVELSAFPSHVERMHKDSNLLFADAFKMLKDKSPVHLCSVAESQQCRPKNRYTNIMPFDRSRVKLRALDDVEGSDFINANYIPGYTSPRAFIATQGPMQMTFDDFWRMVWEQNVDTIVMLTKLSEKGRIKCDQYWPNTSEPVFYGDLSVSIQSESNLSDYTLKIFEIKTSKGASRMVKHFWYLKWPDMGCPEDPKMLLDFVKTVRQHTHRPDRTSPTVVHCSAGVGRTGTFIAVDNLLQHIRDHDSVDIFQLVLDMREHRCNMVQTEDQFVYIYECLKAFITTDEEEEPVYQNADIGAENIYENAAFQTDL